MADRLEELLEHLTPAERAELVGLLATAPVLVAVPAAAARLGVHRATIYRMERAGTLRGLRVAGRLVIFADSLDEAAAQPRYPGQTP